MMSNDVAVFLWGFTACAAAAISVTFARYWRRSGDRFFLWFTIAFALLSAERFLALAVREGPEVRSPFLYVVRLAAFVMIIVGIVEKNRL